MMEQNIILNAKKFLNFLNKSPTPFHVVESAKKLLTESGFHELKLTDSWTTKSLGKYFVTKNESTLIAFAIGGNYVNGNGFAIVGAHTDSPCLRVKLQSKRVKHGFLQVGVECYGGGIWHTWFDRDLTVAGRVLIHEDDKIVQKLVHIDKPILKIPNLAIHLNREVNEKFTANRESHLVPILASSVQEQLTTGLKSVSFDAKNDLKQVDKHHPVLINLICKELNCEPNQIYDIELYVADVQPACLGGAFDEFIFGPRLDNQVSAYCSIQSLIESTQDDTLQHDTCIRMAAIYDHEEIGSESAQGAQSSLTEHILRRLSGIDTFELAMARSFLLSADQAHGLHPNYSEYHEELHRPALNGGIVIKYNSNQRYATNPVSASIIREAAMIANTPVQDFMVKNDSSCGTTIGPILSAKLGITTVDVGMPQWSMHSIRETGSTISITQCVDVFKAFYSNYSKIKSKFAFL